MTKAVIYARYSSHNQRDASIEDQVRVCREDAERRGDEIVGIYADRAVSGTSDRRDQFQKMIADAERADWDVVYTYKTDRFARSRYDSAVYKSRLRKFGKTIVCSAESIPEGPDGIILESVLEGMAEYYSANLSQNVKRGMEGNAMKCMANGVRKFGFDIVDGRYAINEEEAGMLRRAAREWVEGRSLRSICATTCLGYRTYMGGAVTPGMLSRAFRDEKYRGVYAFGSTRIEGGMPRVFDAELCGKLDARMQADRRGRRDANVAYMLSGVLVDEDGNKFWGNSGRNHDNVKYRYYRCAATGRTFPMDEVEARVVGSVQRMLAHEGVADVIADAVLDAQEAAMADEYDERAALEKRIDSIGRERSRLIDLVAKIGADDEVAAKIGELKEEKEAAEAELAELMRGAPVVTREHVLFWAREMARKDDPRELIPAFVDRVVVGDECVRVEFRLRDLMPEGVGSDLLQMAGVPGFEPR